MGWKERIEERRRREEAKSFFRDHNPEFFSSVTWLKLIASGLGMSIVFGLVYTLFVMITHIEFAYVLALLGIAIAKVFKKISHTGNFKIAILTIVFYVLGLYLSYVFQTVYYFSSFLLNSGFHFSLLFEGMVWHTALSLMADSGIMTGIIYLIGGLYAYQYALND